MTKAIPSFGITRRFSRPDRYNSQGKRIHHRQPGAMDFVAIDGEGITPVGGVHTYALIGIGNDQLENPNGLQWEEVFSFLYDHYRPGVAFVGFFLGYDFNQIFKTMPFDRAKMLLTEEGRKVRQRRNGKTVPFPVRCREWEFDILAMKRLKIRPRSCEHDFERGRPACKCPKKPWMYICDTGSFFQASLLSVIDPSKWIDPIVTQEEYEFIKLGKEQRSEFTEITPEIRAYNRLENEILCRVLRELDKGFRGFGVCLPPSKWFGPGQAAQAWLRNEGVITREKLTPKIPEWALEAAMASYYGGWFEIMMHGIIPGESHEYDINSAYPAIIAQLPCLEHGKWSKGEGHPTVNEGELCLVRARVWGRSNLSHHTKGSRIYVGAMLHRDYDGRISRPTITEGWFWWHELEAARKAKLVQTVAKVPKGPRHPIIYEWLKYTSCDCFPPMRHIANLYLQRLAVGKESPLGKGAKVAYNSAYGKFAQSVGSPVFGNPIYASLITAGCRTMILNAIATHPKGKRDVCMVATDAVYFLSPHPTLRIGEGLGEWSHRSRTNLTLFKPGMYWDDDARRQASKGQAPHFKARGINAADFGPELDGIDRQFRSWNGCPPPISNVMGAASGWPTVAFRAHFTMVTCSQAIQRGNWEEAGAISDEEMRTQSSNPADKRASVYYDEKEGIYRSEPHEPGCIIIQMPGGGLDTEQDCRSYPYEKRFGLEDPFSDTWREQMGITEDGFAYDLIGFAWKGINDA